MLHAPRPLPAPPLPPFSHVTRPCACPHASLGSASLVPPCALWRRLSHPLGDSVRQKEGVLQNRVDRQRFSCSNRRLLLQWASERASRRAKWAPRAKGIVADRTDSAETCARGALASCFAVPHGKRAQAPAHARRIDPPRLVVPPASTRSRVVLRGQNAKRLPLRTWFARAHCRKSASKWQEMPDIGDSPCNEFSGTHVTPHCIIKCGVTGGLRRQMPLQTAWLRHRAPNIWQKVSTG